MTIDLEVTAKDYRAFIGHVTAANSAPNPQRMIGRFVGVGIGLFFGFLIILTGMGRDASNLGATFCGVFLGSLMMVIIFIVIAQIQIRRLIPSTDGIILGKHQITLCPEGVRQHTKHHEVLFNWSTVQGVGVTSLHLFVMVDRVGGLIIPKAAFSSVIQSEEFVAEIQRHSNPVSK